MGNYALYCVSGNKWKSRVRKMANKYRFLELDQKASEALTAFMNEMVLKENLSARRRGQAVDLSGKHRTVPEIAGDLKCSERSVYEWLRQYRKYGLAGIHPRAQPTKLTSEQIDEMMKISGRWPPRRVGKDPVGTKAWSFRKIAAWVRANWHINISDVRLRQIITRRIWNDPRTTDWS